MKRIEPEGSTERPDGRRSGIFPGTPPGRLGLRSAPLGAFMRFTVVVVVLSGVISLPAYAADPDADSIDSLLDNCAAVFNPLQEDCDGNGTGDACEAGGNPDVDFDGVCDAVDNCRLVPNAEQGDCNGNGVGNLCEAANANRDTDRDGVCNGADPCPLEATNCDLQAITVQFDPARPELPHPSYSGATHTLKGIARYGGNQFMWDFGDGQQMAWTAITNPSNLGVNHVYTGALGQLFTATLSVRNSASPSTVATATYRVQLLDSGPLPADLQMEPRRMDVRADMAIDQALWFLHTTMSRGTYADGAPGYAQAYGYWTASDVKSTCFPVAAFQKRGHRVSGDFARDPYVETVQRGLNYLVAGNLIDVAIGDQVHAGLTDRPDLNRNGVGLRLGTDDLFTTRGCSVVLAETGAPGWQTLVGVNTNVLGRTHRQLLQDVVERFAWGQTDSGTFRGGWGEGTMNTTSATTWNGGVLAVLPTLLAGEAMGAKTPPFVKSELPYFMTYARHAALDSLNGSWGFNGPSTFVNHRGAATGILFHNLLGNGSSHPQQQAALGFLYRYWEQRAYDGTAWSGMLGEGLVMYAVATALRTASPPIGRVVEYDYNTSQQTSNGFDWYYQPPGQTRESLSSNLVRRQAASGSWSDATGNDAASGAFATGLGVLTLLRDGTPQSPLAAICDCSETYKANQPVSLDGRCSTHPASGRAISSYEWDFVFDGTFDAGVTGAVATLASGYPANGDQRVVLRVTDDTPAAQGGPRVGFATCSISVSDGPHCPHARAGAPLTGFRATPLSFDATASSDPDGDPLTFAWDFDNDGLFGAADTSVFGAGSDGVGATPSFSFPSEGSFTVAVRVTDAPAGGASPCGKVASTTVSIVNRAPVARAGGPYVGAPGAVVALTAASSSDPDGDSLTFAWDLDGDLSFDDGSSAAVTFTIPTGTADGTTFDVCVEVNDGRTGTSRACSTVQARVNRAPVCSQAVPSAAAECVATVTVQLDGSGSSDPDGDPLQYTWTTSCAGGVIAPAAAATTSVSLPGTACTSSCQVTLTVSDGALQTQCTSAIAVTDSRPPSFSRAPADLSLECGASQQAAISAWLADAGAVDACTTTTLVNDYAGLDGGCSATTGAALVRWTATDGCGHAASTTATVRVVDGTAPVLSCPASLTVECAGATTPVSLSATAMDACAGALAPSTASSDRLPRGTTSLEFQATDPCGNTGRCTAMVTVADTTAPVFEASSLGAQTVVGNCAGTAVPFAPATATDVCGTVTVRCAPVSGTSFGANSVECTATDEAGLVTRATLTITVTDPGCGTLSDAGMVIADAGASGEDAGVGGEDAGVVGEDAGVGGEDAGVGGEDAGVGSGGGSGGGGGSSAGGGGGATGGGDGAGGGGATAASCGCAQGAEGSALFALFALALLASRRRTVA